MKGQFARVWAGLRVTTRGGETPRDQKQQDNAIYLRPEGAQGELQDLKLVTAVTMSETLPARSCSIMKSLLNRSPPGKVLRE